MLDGGWANYAAIFAGSALLSLVLTPLALRLAERFRVLDQPAENKAHGSPVPYLGGLAIVLAFAAAVIGAALIERPPQVLDELGIVLGIAIVLSVIGLLDDIRGLTPWLRLAVEIGAGAGVWGLGAGVDLFSVGAVNLALTVAWVVGITNAFNLLDNMDGLSAGTAAIGAGGIAVIGAANDQYFVASLGLALAGCALGFLRHNFHPARIYMGDAGSLFLGFMLSYLGLKLRFEGRPDEITFLVPILILGVAVLDTSLVTVTRLLNRRSPLQGGLDHTSHRLVFMGIPVRAAVGLIYGVAVGLSVTAFVVSRSDRLSAYLLSGLALVGGAFLALLLARIPVYRGREAWNAVDEARAAELIDSMRFEEEAGRPVRNRQARLGSLFTVERSQR